MKLNNGHLSQEAFLKPIQICQGYHTVKIAINYNPEVIHITKAPQLVLKQCPPGLTEALIKEGYSYCPKDTNFIGYIPLEDTNFIGYIPLEDTNFIGYIPPRRLPFVTQGIWPHSLKISKF